MKKILLCSLVLILFSQWSSAQCNQKVTWFASRMEKLDEKGNVVSVKEGNISIEIGKEKLLMKVAERSDVTLEGIVLEHACDWKEPFRVGGSKVDAQLSDGRGNATKDLITIEGKEDKIVLMLYRDGRTFRFPIEKYEVADL